MSNQNIGWGNRSMVRIVHQTTSLSKAMQMILILTAYKIMKNNELS